REVALRHLPVHGDRGGQGHHRPRGDRVQDRRRAALLSHGARHQQGGGRGDDRVRLHRARGEGAADGVRGRDEPVDPAADGGLRRMTAHSPKVTPAPAKGPTAPPIARSWAEKALARAQAAREGAWALERRRAAAATLSTLGLPRRDDELWRRTDFGTLQQSLDALQPFTPPPPAR